MATTTGRRCIFWKLRPHDGDADTHQFERGQGVLGLESESAAVALDIERAWNLEPIFLGHGLGTRRRASVDRPVDSGAQAWHQSSLHSFNPVLSKPAKGTVLMPRNLVRFLVLLVALLTFGCDKKQGDEQSASTKEVAESAESAEPESTTDRSPVDDSAAPDKAEDSSQVVERSLMWRVETDQGRVYLFGTVHGGIDGTWEQFPPDARAALEESELVVLEADLENAAASATEVRDKMMYPSGESLRDKLGDEAFARLTGELGMPAAVLERMRPWAVYSELTRKWLPPGKAVDELVQQQGKALGREFEYIETIPQQVDILADAITVDVLRDTLQRLDEMKEQQDELIAAYVAGDADRIEDVAFDEKEMERFPELYEALFDERNRAWMSDIEGYTEQGDVFVAVGVGHLVGDGGLVARLEKRGYEVERTAVRDGTSEVDAAAE